MVGVEMWVTAASSLEIMILCSVTVPAIGPHSVSLALVVAASMPVAGAGTTEHLSARAGARYVGAGCLQACSHL